MIDREKFREDAGALEALLKEKLGGHGRGLARLFARAGRLLPRRIRSAGGVITEAEAALDHPKLARLHDPERVDAAFGEVRAHLDTVDPVDRRKGLILGILASAVFNLILLTLAIVAFLNWHGLP